jgi:hypothetical protein
MFVQGKPKLWLRADGLFLFAATIAIFSQLKQHWWLYIALLFVPDIFMVGYLRNSKVGAFFYNLGHSYPAPLTTFLVAWLNNSYLGMAIAIIWVGHIGWDRALGYGLKYDTRFKDTHLGSLDKPSL